METKTKKTTSGRTVVVYVSRDGNEFDSKKSCFNYEMSEAKKAVSESNDVKENEKAVDMLPFDGEDHSWECEYRWYMPLNISGVELMNRVFGFSGDNVSEREIGKWVCVGIGSSDAWFEGTLDNSIKYASEMCDRFGLRPLEKNS